MAEGLSEVLDQIRRDAGLSLDELWLRYLELGGMGGALELEALLYGALRPSAHDDVIIDALGRRCVAPGGTVQAGRGIADEMFARAAESRIAALEADLAKERERSRRLEEQLGNLADHDPITDLLNRGSVEDELEEHRARCARFGPEGALLLIGVDGLEDIACALGRRASDEALAELADMVGNRLHATDVVGRWGPDELVVLLPRAVAAESALVADEIVRIVGEAGTAQVPPGTLVASIGVAPVIATPLGDRELMARANLAMVGARGHGGGWVAAEGGPTERSEGGNA